jgi:hypothetical protein
MAETEEEKQAREAKEKADREAKEKADREAAEAEAKRKKEEDEENERRRKAGELWIDGEKFDPERAHNLIVKLREEGKTSTARLKELEDKVKEAEREKMSEGERREAELKEAREKAEEAERKLKERDEQYNRERLIRRIESTGRDLGITDTAAEDLHKLIETDGLMDDEGKVDDKRVKAAVEKILERHPYMKGEPGAKGVPRTPSGDKDEKPKVEEVQKELHGTGNYRPL